VNLFQIAVRVVDRRKVLIELLNDLLKKYENDILWFQKEISNRLKEDKEDNEEMLPALVMQLRTCKQNYYECEIFLNRLKSEFYSEELMNLIEFKYKP
jgi:predicted CoA-binding protein